MNYGGCVNARPKLFQQNEWWDNLWKSSDSLEAVEAVLTKNTDSASFTLTKKGKRP